MIEKLRSHLRRSRGFTLVELLIVIAIIAILILLVIIALNPLQRIHDGNDQRAGNSVRSVATAVEGCLSRTEADFATCGTQAGLESNVTEGGPWVRAGTITWGTGVGEITVTATATSVDICSTGGANAPGGDAPSWYHWNTGGGTVEHVEVACN